MVKACCVKGCKNESYAGCNMSFHKFPENEEMRQKWLQAIPIRLVKTSVVCRAHFKPEDIKTSMWSRKTLIPTAVPSIFPNAIKKEIDSNCTEIIRKEEQKKESEKIFVKRKRLTSSSSNSSYSNFSLSEDEPEIKSQKCENKPQRRLNRVLKPLHQTEISTKSSNFKNNDTLSTEEDSSSMKYNFSEYDPDLESVQSNDSNISEPHIVLYVNTKVNESTKPQELEDKLKQLKDLQRFDHPDWSHVHYAEVEKSYLRSPGFTNLEPNEEVKHYDRFKFAVNMERAFAGITYALLKQQEALENDINFFLNWSKSTENLNNDNICSKIQEIFSAGSLSKVSADTLKLVCGHRAELIQQRRDGILNSVKNPVHKHMLKKIPPSCSTLFNADKFSSMLKKAGGKNEVFWPEEEIEEL